MPGIGLETLGYIVSELLKILENNDLDQNLVSGYLESLPTLKSLPK